MNPKYKNQYLEGIKGPFEKYKTLGEKTFEQLSEKQLFEQIDEDSNSIAILVKHLWGNMRSRWTDFLTTDGEKKWRHRDTEFENDLTDREEVRQKWNEAWRYFYQALNELTEEDLSKTVYIRNVPYTVMEAINLQLAHCAYHIGQIVYIGKMLSGSGWKSLSIPKGESEAYFAAKFNESSK